MVLVDFFKKWFSPDKAERQLSVQKPLQENTWLRNDTAPSEDLFFAAFRQVMRGVKLREQFQGTLMQLIQNTINSAGRKQQETIFAYLHDKEWSWPDLDRWQRYFENLGKWPFMWRGDSRELMSAEAILTRCRIDGVTSWELARVLDKKNLGKYFSESGKPVDPKTKVAAMRELARCSTVEDIKQHLPPSVLEEALYKIQKNFEWAMCGLLAHTVIMRFYKLQRAVGDEKMFKVSVSPENYRILSNGCPVEDLFGEKWERGELVGLPPFFPGDRTALFWKDPKRTSHTVDERY